jgi:SlyX protein
MSIAMSELSTDRLESLEIRLTYQEEMIETLNATVTAQWAQIDALKRELARLGDRMQEAESRAGTTAQPDQRPPHY